MKLVTYSMSKPIGRSEAARAGLLDGETIVDLARAFGALGRSVDGATVLGLVCEGARGLDAAREALDAHTGKKLPATFKDGPVTVNTTDARLLSPIPRPPSMRDGYAFRQHV